MTRALVTGGSGFVGRHAVAALTAAGRDVTVLPRGPITLEGAFDEVYHVAGRAHLVPRTDAERAAFHNDNVALTRELLDALSTAPPSGLLLVSTVAVYGVTEGDGYDEDTPRAATDPYGVSKRDAEDLVSAWGAEHGVRVAIVRLPLVAGPGAPGNLGAMVRALRRGRYLGVGDGSGRRSVVLVDEAVAAFPDALRVGGTYHLTDGRHPTFAELEVALSAALGRRPPRRLPRLVARVAGRLGDVLGPRAPVTSDAIRKMTSSLTFSDERARAALGWQSTPVVERARELVA